MVADAMSGTMPRTRVAVAGSLGSMGNAVVQAVLADQELELVAAVDVRYVSDARSGAGAVPEGIRRCSSLEAALTPGDVDVVVDFTLPEAVYSNVVTCLSHHVATVVGTSGLGTDEISALEHLSLEARTPVFVAPNFALGAVLAMQFAEQAARVFGTCEIVELHHDRKVDAPSGTARRTATLVQDAWSARGLERTVPIHSVRLPGLVAHQEVMFGGSGETLTIRHDSLSRESFMAGVLLAVKRVSGLQGLVLGLEKIL
jgi:4-hydroxy-tetrahydrodipicolinate reductase